MHGAASIAFSLSLFVSQSRQTLSSYYYRACNAPTRDLTPKPTAVAMKASTIDEGLAEARASLGLIQLFE